MSRIYIMIILGIIALSAVLSSVITLKNKNIELQKKEITKLKIEKKTSSIAATAIGEIYQLERTKNVKKPHNIGANTATF